MGSNSSQITPFRHVWTISGLSSVCDRITAHPYIKSIVCEKFEIRLYPKGYDESCREFVSLGLFYNDILRYPIVCKISIKSTKEENPTFVKDIILEKFDAEDISKLSIDDIMRFYNERMNMNECYLKEYIQLDYLLDPVNNFTHNDNSHNSSEFTLCFEGISKYDEIEETNLDTKSETKDYFDFSPLLTTKSFALKYTIENAAMFWKIMLPDYTRDKHCGINLPKIKDCSENDEVIFCPSFEPDEKKLAFKLKSNFKGPIIAETSLLNVDQQKCNSQKKKDLLDFYCPSLDQRYCIDEKMYRTQLINDKLTLFCSISMINEPETKENNYLFKYNYCQMLECFKVPSVSQITEWTIDGETFEIQFTLQNTAKTLSSSTEVKILEKLEELSTSISEQRSSIDQTIINVNKIYHEHNFEGADLDIGNWIINKSKSNTMSDVKMNSEHSDCASIIEKLRIILSNEVRLALEKNEKMYNEMKQSYDANLRELVLENQELILENRKQEIMLLQSELDKMSQTGEDVKKAEIKHICDRIIALLNKMKNDLNKFGTNIKRVQESKSHKSPTFEKENSIPDSIEFHTGPLIKCVQSVPTSASISTETKEGHIHNLNTVKNFLIEHLPAKNDTTGNQMSIE